MEIFKAFILELERSIAGWWLPKPAVRGKEGKQRISRAQLQETKTTVAILSRKALTREQQVFTTLLGGLEEPAFWVLPPLPPMSR